MRWCRGLAVFLVLLVHTLPAAADGDARGFVEQYITAAKRIRGDASLSADQKNVQIQALLHQAYDFAGAPRAILGRHWAKASSEQQQRYLEQFERYIIVAYSKRFDEVAAGLAITGSSVEDKRTVVHSTSAGRQSEPTLIDWVVIQPEGAQWRIADVVVNGVGSVETMRQEFSAVLRANHDDIDGLIAALRQRTEAVRTGG